jgi:hypothetical protein
VCIIISGAAVVVVVVLSPTAYPLVVLCCCLASASSHSSDLLSYPSISLKAGIDSTEIRSSVLEHGGGGGSTPPPPPPLQHSGLNREQKVQKSFAFSNMESMFGLFGGDSTHVHCVHWQLRICVQPLLLCLLKSSRGCK